MAVQLPDVSLQELPVDTRKFTPDREHVSVPGDNEDHMDRAKIRECSEPRHDKICLRGSFVARRAAVNVAELRAILVPLHLEGCHWSRRTQSQSATELQ